MLPAEKSKRPRWWKLWLRQFQLLMWKNWLLAVILFERIQNIHMLKVSISKSYRNEHLEPYLCRSALRWCLCFCCSLFKRWLWPIVRTPAMIEIMIAVGHHYYRCRALHAWLIDPSSKLQHSTRCGTDSTLYSWAIFWLVFA